MNREMEENALFNNRGVVGVPSACGTTAIRESVARLMILFAKELRAESPES